MSKHKVIALCGAGTASALLLAGLVMAPAAGAAESADSAYAIAASGIVSVPETPLVTGSGDESLATVSLPPNGPAVITAKVLNAEAESAHAKAGVAELTIDLAAIPGAPAQLPTAPKITAELVAAECDNGEGSTSLASLKIGDQEHALDQIPPNTTIPLDPVLNVVLNKQVSNDDGSLTVTAVSVDVLNGTQTLDLSSATCAKGGEPTTSTEPTPTTTSSNGDDDGSGDKPDDDGKAPKPTPAPGHLDVTG